MLLGPTDPKKPTPNSQTDRRLIDVLADFLAWCAGADPDALRESPSARPFYMALGSCALTFSILSGLMLMIAVSYVTGGTSPWDLWYVGVLWTVIMSSVERLVLQVQASSIKALIAVAIPRMTISLLMALAISHVAALEMYKPEISNILSQNRAKDLAAADKSVQATYGPQIFNIKDQIAELQANERKVQSRITRRDLQAETAKTVDGVCAIRCQYYQRLAEVDRTRLGTMRSRNEGRIAGLRAKGRHLREERRQVLKDRQTTINNQDGLLARVDALDTLQKKNDAVAFQVLLLELLLIALDLTPLTAKLMRSLTVRGDDDPYSTNVKGRQAEESLTGKERMERARTEEARFKDDGRSARRQNRWRTEQEEFSYFDTEGETFMQNDEPTPNRPPITGHSLNEFVGKMQDWETRPIEVPGPLRRGGLIGLTSVVLTAVLAITLTFVQDGDAISGLLFVLMAAFAATVLFIYTKGFRTAPTWGLRGIFFTLIGGLLLPFFLLLLNL